MLKAELDRIKQERAKNIIKPVELNVYKIPEGLKAQGPTLQLTRKAQFQDKIWGPPPDARLLHESDDDEDPDEPTHPTPSYPGHSTQTQPGRAARQNPSTTRPNPPKKSKLDKIRKEVRANSLFQHHSRNQHPEMKLNPMSTNKVIGGDKIIAKNKIVSTNKFVRAQHKKVAVSQPFNSIKPPTVFAPMTARPQPGQATVGKGESRHLASATKSTSTPQRSEHRITGPLPNADEPLPSIETPSNIATLLAAVHETTITPPTQPLNTPDPTRTTTKAAASTPNKGGIHPPRRDSPYVRPSGNTSSPNRLAVRPPMQIKRKQPVDIFMRPTKRQRAD